MFESERKSQALWVEKNPYAQETGAYNYNNDGHEAVVGFLDEIDGF
jgi:hypothetical protein